MMKTLKYITNKYPYWKCGGSMRNKIIVVSLLVTILLLGSLIVSARPAYLANFNDQYGTEDTKLDTCNTCHVNPNGGGTRNPYGIAYQESGMDFASIESLDSDEDGFTNLEEINSLTFPGDPEDNPGTQDIDPSDVTVVNESDPAGEQVAENTSESANNSPEQETTDEPVESPISEEQAPGFGAILTGLGVLSAIYWYRK